MVNEFDFKYDLFMFFKSGKISGSISKTVLESGTKIGQSGPVKSFSSTAEAISAQIESETSLNSHVSSLTIILKSMLL